MHYHCEIILPPNTADIVAAVELVMRPFGENRGSDEDYDISSKHAFWDFYKIGGRMAGTKHKASLDQDKLATFCEWLTAEKITVSAVRCGKPELSPASQIPRVDAKWNEMFPSGTPMACALFAHSNNQYGEGTDGTIAGDIGKLGDALKVKCERVIFAGPSYNPETKELDGPMEATFMVAEDAWNGVNHMPVAWDQTVGGALEQFRQSLKTYRYEYRARIQPTDDWIAVTVDYHS